MGLTNIFKITGTALNAHSLHIDLIAKNMANSQVVSGSEAGAYRANRPVFASLLNSGFGRSDARGSAATSLSFGRSEVSGVQVSEIARSDTPIEKQRMPGSPLADADGYVYLSNVNLVEEMAYMMQASRSYQSNVEVMNTSKQLMLRTLSMGSR